MILSIWPFSHGSHAETEISMEAFGYGPIALVRF